MRITGYAHFIINASGWLLRLICEEGFILLKSWFPVYIHGSIAVGIYILLRAVDRFAANYNSFPGQFDR